MRAEAEALLGKDEFAVATQRLLQARDGFERARRARRRRRGPRPRRAAGRGRGRRRRRRHRSPARGAAPPSPCRPSSPSPPVTARPPRRRPPAPAARRARPRDPAVIADYARAIEGKDLALFRAVKPNLSGDEEKRLQESFKAIKSQQVGITIDSIQVDGAQATVRVSRQDTINGKPMRAVHQTFRLAQAGPGWTIQTIGQ